MTAIVGTLNKRGIAIAADSAATYSTSAINLSTRLRCQQFWRKDN